MTEWSTAVPDWEDRLLSGRSLIPALPLNRAEADRALRVFKRLKAPDIVGKPAMAEIAGQWFLDIVEVIFGAYFPTAGVRRISEVFVLVPKKNGKSSYSGSLALTTLIVNRRPAAEFLFVAPTKTIANIAFRQAELDYQGGPGARRSVSRPDAHPADHAPQQRRHRRDQGGRHRRDHRRQEHLYADRRDARIRQEAARRPGVRRGARRARRPPRRLPRPADDAEQGAAGRRVQGRARGRPGGARRRDRQAAAAGALRAAAPRERGGRLEGPALLAAGQPEFRPLGLAGLPRGPAGHRRAHRGGGAGALGLAAFQRRDRAFAARRPLGRRRPLAERRGARARPSRR